MVPSYERERYWITSPVTTLAFHQVVSVNIQAFSYPENNVFQIWLSGSYGHSRMPVAIYTGNKWFSDSISRQGFPLVINTTASTKYNQYDICLRAGHFVLTLEAIYGTPDEFVVNSVSLPGVPCDIDTDNMLTGIVTYLLHNWYSYRLILINCYYYEDKCSIFSLSKSGIGLLS